MAKDLRQFILVTLSCEWNKFASWEGTRESVLVKDEFTGGIIASRIGQMNKKRAIPIIKRWTRVIVGQVGALEITSP